MTQKDMVLEHMQTYCTITPLEALTRYGIMRLAAVVHDLRNEGFVIGSKLKQHNGRHYASYSFGTGESNDSTSQQDLFQMQ